MLQATVFIAYCGAKWVSAPSPEAAITLLRGELGDDAMIQVKAALVTLDVPVEIDPLPGAPAPLATQQRTASGRRAHLRVV